MSGRIEICEENDLGTGDRIIVVHEDSEIGVFNVGGNYVAIENTCPHLGGPVCEGRRGRAIEAEYVRPGRRLEESFTDDETIACPWHGWEFRIRTGEHLGDDTVSLTMYDVLVEDGTIFVDV